MIHDARVVPLVDTPGEMGSLNDEVRLWMGDSRGYWDGDTLVVQTRNFNGLASSFGQAGTSQDKVLTERFTRRGAYTVDYEFTVDEYACHEGNYGMVNILRGARVQDALAESEAQ